MDSPREDDPPFQDLSPRERISYLLSFVDNHNQLTAGMYTAQSLEEHQRQFWPDITQKIIDAILEDPSLAEASFVVGRSEFSPKMPLMHWLCRLDAELPLVRAVRGIAGSASLRLRATRGRGIGERPEGALFWGVLPIDEACWNGSSVDLIHYLLEEYPDSATSQTLQKALVPTRSSQVGLGQEGDPFDPNCERMVLYRLFADKMSEEEVLTATRELRLGWSGSSVMPLGLIREVARLHQCKSVRVRTFQTSGCDIEVKGDELICTVECSRTFDFALEQLLMLPLPLKAIQATDLDIPQATLYLIDALDPPQEDPLANKQDFLAQHMSFFGRTYQPKQLPPPLDLSSVEILDVDAVIPDEDTMVAFMLSIRHLPNLKELHLSGFMSRIEGYDFPVTETCYKALGDALGESPDLKEFSLTWVDEAFAEPFVEFLLAHEQIERVTFRAPDPLSVDQIKTFARYLRGSKGIRYLKLVPMEEGAELIVDAVKDNGSTLEEFVTEEELESGSEPKIDSSLIDACLIINKVQRNLSSESIGKDQAFDMYAPHVHNTVVLYSLLRYRPELWSGV